MHNTHTWVVRFVQQVSLSGRDAKKTLHNMSGQTTLGIKRDKNLLPRIYSYFGCASSHNIRYIQHISSYQLTIANVLPTHAYLCDVLSSYKQKGIHLSHSALDLQPASKEQRSTVTVWLQRLSVNRQTSVEKTNSSGGILFSFHCYFSDRCEYEYSVILKNSPVFLHFVCNIDFEGNFVLLSRFFCDRQYQPVAVSS